MISFWDTALTKGKFPADFLLLGDYVDKPGNSGLVTPPTLAFLPSEL